MNDSEMDEKDDLDRLMDEEEARNPGFKEEVEWKLLWREIDRRLHEEGRKDGKG